MSYYFTESIIDFKLGCFACTTSTHETALAVQYSSSIRSMAASSISQRCDYHNLIQGEGGFKKWIKNQFGPVTGL